MRSRTDDAGKRAVDEVRGGAVVERERVRDRSLLDQPVQRGTAFGLAIVVRTACAREKTQTGERIEAGSRRIGQPGLKPADCSGADAGQNGPGFPRAA